MADQSIEVRNLRPGRAPVVAIFDLQVDDLTIYGVTLRRGRGQASYVNFPCRRVGDRWECIVKVTSPALLDAVVSAVWLAVGRSAL